MVGLGVWRVGRPNVMAGASADTERVQYLNVNWEAGGTGEDGVFSVLVVTEDGERHSLSLSPAAATALIALTQASSVVLWDAKNRTLIAANLIGEWLQQDWSTGDTRHSS